MYNICFGTQYRSRRSGAPWGYQGRKAVSRLVAKGMLYNTALYVYLCGLYVIRIMQCHWPPCIPAVCVYM